MLMNNSPARQTDPLCSLFGISPDISRINLYRWCRAKWPGEFLIGVPAFDGSPIGTTVLKVEYLKPLKSWSCSGGAFFAPPVWEAYFLSVIPWHRPATLFVKGSTPVKTASVLPMHLACLPSIDRVLLRPENRALAVWLSGVPTMLIAALWGEPLTTTLRAIKAQIQRVCVDLQMDGIEPYELTYSPEELRMYHPHPVSLGG